MAVAAAVDTVPVSQGIRGIQPEPARGFKTAGGRDRALEAFCAAVWDRHEVRGQRPNPRMWPTSGAFKSNMPGIAFDLIVAAWKVTEAGADDARLLHPPDRGEERTHWLYGTSSCDSDVGNPWVQARHSAAAVAEMTEELLDPPAPAERDCRDVYAVELARHPAILEDLERGEQGDGIERVLERAGLTTSERLVIRGWLAGDDIATIAADLGWRPQTVSTLHRNGLYRLEDLTRWSKPRTLQRPASRSSAGVAVAS
jgi:hypothetical protein